MLNRLLQWYDEHKRDLPWREDPAPYHVWISEIMLQQTRVEAVKDYYRRFLDTLPDIASLADADEDVYLKLWEGLGYYSRVRNLHKAAVQIMEDYGGNMPSASGELSKLAGIGPYTAAAIASIAFGERIPAIDGNLMRIFARLSLYEGSIKAGVAQKAAQAFYLKHFPQERAGDMNQALMDLGATVCLPNSAPQCSQCPLAESCLAHLAGRETELPCIPPKKERLVLDKTVFLIYYNKKLALSKRPRSGLLAGLYEFPNTEGHLTPDEAVHYLEGLGITVLQIRSLPEAKHIFSHREWHMTGYEVRAGEWTTPPEDRRPEGLFLASKKEMEEVYSIPSAFSAYAAEIRF